MGLKKTELIVVPSHHFRSFYQYYSYVADNFLQLHNIEFLYFGGDFIADIDIFIIFWFSLHFNKKIYLIIVILIKFWEGCSFNFTKYYFLRIELYLFVYLNFIKLFFNVQNYVGTFLSLFFCVWPPFSVTLHLAPFCYICSAFKLFKILFFRVFCFQLISFNIIQV